MALDRRPKILRAFAYALVAAASLTLAERPAEGAACQVLVSSSKFDPPSGGVSPSYMLGRQDEIAVGGSGSGARLLVKYNYGFLVYSLASPASPSPIQTKDMWGQDGYFKGADGQTRIASATMSSDGARALAAWAVNAGTAAFSSTPFSNGGDYAPSGSQVTATAVVKSGSKYLAFSAQTNPNGPDGLIYVADITNLPTGQKDDQNPSTFPIASEAISTPSIGKPITQMEALEAGGRSYLLAASSSRVAIFDVTNVGSAVPNLSAGFTSRSYSMAELGLTSGSLYSASAAVHPTDGGLYVFAEATVLTNSSVGTSLTRIDPNTLAPGTPAVWTPPSTRRRAQVSSLVLPLDSEVIALFGEGDGVDGPIYLNARSSNGFQDNLAEGVILSGPSQVQSIDAYRSSGGTFTLYFGQTSAGVWATTLNCALAPTEAQGLLTVDKKDAAGAWTAVPSGGDAFIGQELRLRPSYSPPDSLKPLLDWRFDYDFHDGNTADSSPTTLRVSNPDLAYTTGSGVPTELTLFGPCDPKQPLQAGGNAVPSTGAGCWESVTTNAATLGASDFADAINPASRSLTIGYEVRNALNATSSLVKHAITWKVPKALLKSTAILSGGTVEQASEGTPDLSSNDYRWYFATEPGGTTLTKAACTGPTCNPGLTAAGTYAYWVSVPYKGGYRTPDCPGLSGSTCTGDPLGQKTITVTDVVLNLSAPTSALAGSGTVKITSTSQKGAVTACPVGGSAFTYDLCNVSGSSCPVGTYSGNGLLQSGDPFAGGYLTISTPPAGAYGLRIRYAYYTGAGSCSNPTYAYWPAPGASQDWAPLSVVVAAPGIKLFSDQAFTKPLVLQFGLYQVPTGVAAYAYPYLNSAPDPNPPTLTWSYRNNRTGQTYTVQAFGKGARFTVTDADEYTLTMSGYGQDADVGFLAGDITPPDPLSVSSVSVSPLSPVVNQNATVTCVGAGGTAPYRWDISFGDGQSVTNSSSSSVSHAWTSAGSKTVTCKAYDSASGTASLPRTINVVDQSSGSCDFVIKSTAGTRISYDSASKTYDTTSGKPLVFEATGVDSSVAWSFGNGATGSGNPANYTYVITGADIQTFTARLTSGSCSKSYGVNVSPSAGPPPLDFSIADSATGTALAKVDGVYQATAGQSLRFTATGADGALAWDFGDGTFSADSAPVKAYAPAVDQTYAVKLTNGANVKQYSLLVKGSTGAPLTGKYIYRYVDGSTVKPVTVQPNQPIRFTAVDQATTYTWDFGDGTSLATGSPVDHTFTRGGSFIVKLTVARDGVAGTVTTAAPVTFVVLPPPDPLLWVAGGMVFADGSGGERWQSDLSIHNPGTAPASLSLTFVSGAGWAGATNAVWSPLVVGPGETRAFANVLAGFFAAAKGSWGVVLVRGDDVPVPPVIVSRTYNAASADVAGTFGLSVPAISVANGVKPQSAAGGNFLAGLRHDDAFRTNLTVANLKDEASEVEVVFRDGAGNVLGSPAKITVEGRGVKQLNGALSAAVASATDPIGGAGYGSPASQFSAEVRIKSGSGVYPYATVIDQGTGDSIVVTPAATPSPTYRLPGIVRVLGGSGAYWVSDVALLNPTASPRKINVTFSYEKLGTPGRWERTLPFSLAPYGMAVATDFVRSWLGLAADDPDGYANSYVDFVPAADDPTPTAPVVVTGKTYTPSGRGSIGLQLDPYVLQDGINAQGSRRKLVLSGLEASAKFRTNIALFLTPGSTGNVQVDVHVLDSFGRESKKFSNVGLDAGNPFVQINSGDLFSGFSTDDSSRATIVIDNPRGAAYLGAYATVIDQKSGDATFVAGQPAP